MTYMPQYFMSFMGFKSLSPGLQIQKFLFRIKTLTSYKMENY
jgi:hypothetical protein